MLPGQTGSSPNHSGSPPMIPTVTVSAGPSAGHATCDVTPLLRGFLCAGGVTASRIVAFPSLTLDVAYTSTRIEARVLDANSRPDQSDILLVSATYKQGDKCTSLAMRDDGAAIATAFPQTASLAEDCPADSDCPACAAAVYATLSNDRKAGDHLYTVERAFLSDTIDLDAPSGVTLGAQAQLAEDCIAAVNHQSTDIGVAPVGGVIPFKIEAVDRTGNLSTWPETPSITLDQTHLACSGDECACCLLLSANPATECAGRPGLAGVPGSGFETGLCKTL
jgi:hypothetical protein